MNQSLRLLLTSTALVLVGIIPATAQQIMGTPGSPSATTTIDGNYIPNPSPAFGGEINLDAKTQSRGGRQTSCRLRVRPTSC